MKKKRKIVKKFIYEGFGFSIVLENVLFHFIRGEWIPKINVKKLALKVFKKLPFKSSKLTGHEVRFIRTYLEKSKTEFGKLFKLSHTAIGKWEKAKDDPAPMSAVQEIVLRLYLQDYLNVNDREFYKTYKKAEVSVHEEEDTPLKIAM